MNRASLIAAAEAAQSERGAMSSMSSIDRLRMSKERITRWFVWAAVAYGVGFALGIAALWVGLASDAVDFGGDYMIDVNGGSGAWTAVALLVVGSLVILAGTVAGIVSWLAALLNTWQLEDKKWFGALLASGLLGFGVIAMVAYVVAGTDGTQQSAASADTQGALQA
jgi:hypothetical protein